MESSTPTNVLRIGFPKAVMPTIAECGRRIVPTCRVPGMLVEHLHTIIKYLHLPYTVRNSEVTL